MFIRDCDSGQSSAIAQVAEQGIQLAHGDTAGELRHTQTR
jgi:hypothetical protein